MTIKRRLEIYQQCFNAFDTIGGKRPVCICSYLKHHVPEIESQNMSLKDITNELSTLLPELYSTKPDKCWNANSDFWFEPYTRKNRMRCFKQAIKITEDKIKQGEIS